MRSATCPTPITTGVLGSRPTAVISDAPNARQTARQTNAHPGGSRYDANAYGPNRPHATVAASAKSSTFIATIGTSPRRPCTTAAPSITRSSPTAAMGTSTGAICTTAGAMSPTAPQNSAAPIQRIWAWLKPSAPPILPDATSLSFGTPNIISPLDANITASTPATIHSARFIVTSLKYRPPGYFNGAGADDEKRDLRPFLDRLQP